MPDDTDTGDGQIATFVMQQQATAFLRLSDEPQPDQMSGQKKPRLNTSTPPQPARSSRPLTCARCAVAEPRSIFSAPYAAGGPTASAAALLSIVILAPPIAASSPPSLAPPHSLCPFSLFGPRSTAAARLSRRDIHLHASLWPSDFESLRRLVVGALRCPALPPIAFTMSLRRKSSAGVPDTPRIISPSPTPSERDAQDYTGPMTRSRRKTPSQQPVEERSDEESSSDAPALRRSRTRSRSPVDSRAVPRMTPKSPTSQTTKAQKSDQDGAVSGTKLAVNGHLAPPQPATPVGWSWRDFSRSPSPLGLIPIHRHWRTFVHKHEVPRKVLHVSIGFFVVWLYTTGTQTSVVPPYLMSALIPITTVDWLRHRFASFNRFYVKVLGALMRESEYSGWNGVIFYLLGAWIVLYFFPKDVGVVSVLLLSWCDTAASTFGRLWGRYTPRLRRGKSLAGSLAAFLVGVATSYLWYGWLVPTLGPMPGDENFMFKGTLSLPPALAQAVGLTSDMATITGSLALGIMSVWSGFVASASEVADIFGWDDNLTIPVLSGIGICGFLKLFG